MSHLNISGERVNSLRYLILSRLSEGSSRQNLSDSLLITDISGLHDNMCLSSPVPEFVVPVINK